nr:hypothetical protein [Pandoravirus massiliensis]
MVFLFLFFLEQNTTIAPPFVLQPQRKLHAPTDGTAARALVALRHAFWRHEVKAAHRASVDHIPAHTMQGIFVEEGARCGWFSEESAERWGSLIYSTPDGGAVEITAIGKCSDPAPPGEFRGPVVGFLRQGRKGASASTVPPVDMPVAALAEESAALAQSERELAEAEQRLIDSQKALEEKIVETENRRLLSQLAVSVAANQAPSSQFQWNNPYSAYSLSRGLQPFPMVPTADTQAQRAELENAQRRIAEDLDRLAAVEQQSQKATPSRDQRTHRTTLLERSRKRQGRDEYGIEDMPTFSISGPNLYQQRSVYQRQQPGADLAAQLRERDAMLNQTLPPELQNAFSPDALAASYVQWVQNPMDAEGANPFFMVPTGQTPFSAYPRPSP